MCSGRWILAEASLMQRSTLRRLPTTRDDGDEDFFISPHHSTNSFFLPPLPRSYYLYTYKDAAS